MHNVLQQKQCFFVNFQRFADGDWSKGEESFPHLAPGPWDLFRTSRQRRDPWRIHAHEGHGTAVEIKLFYSGMSVSFFLGWKKQSLSPKVIGLTSGHQTTGIQWSTPETSPHATSSERNFSTQLNTSFSLFQHFFSSPSRLTRQD